MTRDEFRDSLQKGQGRVVLHLKEHGANEFREEILEACLHDLTYDPQCEDGRHEWLMSLIDITGIEDFYRERILEALPLSAVYWDVRQLMNLAVSFARRGVARAREVLYETFNQQQFNESWLGGEQIVALDGVAGMLHVAEVIGARLRADPEYWEDANLLSEAQERCGEEVILSALQERAQQSVNVQTYLHAVLNPRWGADPNTVSPRVLPSVAGILSDIERGVGDYPGHYTSFGRRANAKDLKQVFARFLAETRRDQLLRYLWVFRRRALPKLNDRLFQFAESEDLQLQEAAIAALAQMQDSSIRELAIRLLQQRPDTIMRKAISLLQRNYVPGDHQIIELALFVPRDRQACHGIGFDILDVANSQPYPELSGCLKWVYEYSPCSNCREQSLKALLQRDRVTDSFLQESVWDCSEAIRSLARNVLARRS